MFILFNIFHNKHIQGIQTVVINTFRPTSISQTKTYVLAAERRQSQRDPQCNGTHLSTTNQCRAAPTGGDTDSVLSVNLVICDESCCFQNVLNSPCGCFRDNGGSERSSTTYHGRLPALNSAATSLRWEEMKRRCSIKKVVQLSCRQAALPDWTWMVASVLAQKNDPPPTGRRHDVMCNRGLTGSSCCPYSQHTVCFLCFQRPRKRLARVP